MKQTRTLIIGAAGRMGRALMRAALERPEIRISGAVAAPGSAHLGRDAGEVAGLSALGVPVVDDLPGALAHCDVAMDFSRASAAASHIAACCAAGKPLLLGTTGLPGEMMHDLDRAARHIALLVAPNTSLAMTLLTELVRQCAEVLPSNYDIEIIEAHHRSKRDSPSGSALSLGRAAAEGRERLLEELAVYGRSGAEALRREGEIGFASVRGGDVAGDHSVLFLGPGEQLRLEHRASDRAVFARGALDAAQWLAGRAPGRYAMRDLLF